MKTFKKIKVHESQHGKRQSSVKCGRIIKNQTARPPSTALPTHIEKFLDDSREVLLHDMFDKLKGGPMANMVTFKDGTSTTTNKSSESKLVRNRGNSSKGNMHVMMTRSKSKNLTNSADNSSALLRKIFDATTPSCDKLDSLVIEVVKKNKSKDHSFIIPNKKKGQSAEVPLNVSNEPVGNTTNNSLCDQPIYSSTPILTIREETLLQDEKSKLDDSRGLSQCTPSRKSLSKKMGKILCNKFKISSISLQTKSHISIQHRSVDKSKSPIEKTPELNCGDSLSERHAKSETCVNITELDCNDYESENDLLQRCSHSETSVRTIPEREYGDSFQQQQICQRQISEDVQPETSIKPCESDSDIKAILEELFSKSVQIGIPIETSSGEICFDSVSQQHISEYIKSDRSFNTTTELECKNSASNNYLSRCSHSEASVEIIPEREYEDTFQQQQQICQHHISEDVQPETSFKPCESENDGDSILEELFSKSIQTGQAIENFSVVECYDSVSQQHISQQYFTEHVQSVISIKTSDSENDRDSIFKELLSKSAQSGTSIKSTPEMEYNNSLAKDNSKSECLETPVMMTPEMERDASMPQQHPSEYVQSENSIKASPKMECVVYRRTTPEMVHLDSEQRSSHHFDLRESVTIDLTEDVNEEVRQAMPTTIHQPRRMSKPGKSWRRWLHKVSLEEESARLKRNYRRSSMKIVPLSLHRPIKTEEGEELGISEMFNKLSLAAPGVVTMEKQLLARKIVLRQCGQQQPEYFESLYNERTLINCKKIGEGTYGEVFCFELPSSKMCVMKVIPIEGDELVNGEKQKKFCEILSEITVATALSNLRTNCMNFTDIFNEVYRVKCVRGMYPQILVNEWTKFDQRMGSENDHPNIFKNDQLYIILELKNGGTSLDRYKFENPVQIYYMFQQIAFALAVAENALKFEHRDLHWGNILLAENSDEIVKFRLNSLDFCIPTKGVRATIIDFTLSRVEYEQMVIFNDIAEDEELFNGDGDVDYQFEIYRLMKEKNGNNWQQFQPYTNLLWLYYLLDKAIHNVKYIKKRKPKGNTKYMNKLKALKDEVLTYDCVTDFVTRKFISSVVSKTDSITPT